MENSIGDDFKKNQNSQELLVTQAEKKSLKEKLSKFTSSAMKNTATVAKDTLSVIKSGIESTKDYTNKKIEVVKKNIAINNLAYNYEILGQNATVKIYRVNIDDSYIYIKQADKNEKLVVSGSILKNLEDQSKVKVIMVERKKVEQLQLEINGKFETVPSYKISFKNYEEAKTTPYTQNITTTQTISIGEGATTGNINQINNIEKLNQIEDALNSFRPNILQRKQKEEAIKLFGSFKNCILKQQKDEKLFDKFIKVVDTILPSLVTVIFTLI